jgi:hypothetical protein
MVFIPIHPNLMANLNYGSLEWYSEQFSDILAEVDASSPETNDNILNGFLRALDEWLTYHKEQADAYAQLRERVCKALTV